MSPDQFSRDQLPLSSWQVDLVRVDLVAVDLVRIDLVAVDIMRIDLVAVDLVRIDLVAVDLVRIDLMKGSHGSEAKAGQQLVSRNRGKEV